MILNSENRVFPVAQSFDRIVVQVEVGDLQSGGQGVGPDGVTVVLGRYVNPSVAEVLHGVIGPPVAELELERLRAQGAGHHLVDPGRYP